MLSKKRRKELGLMVFAELGGILRAKGVNTDNVKSFSQADFIEAIDRSGATVLERNELIAEMEARFGRVN